MKTPGKRDIEEIRKKRKESGRILKSTISEEDQGIQFARNALRTQKSAEGRKRWKEFTTSYDGVPKQEIERLKTLLREKLQSALANGWLLSKQEIFEITQEWISHEKTLCPPSDGLMERAMRFSRKYIQELLLENGR